MEVLYLRDLDQIFQIWGYVKLETKTNFMLLITTPLKKNKTIPPVCIVFPQISRCSTSMKIKQVLLRSLNLDLAT